MAMACNTTKRLSEMNGNINYWNAYLHANFQIMEMAKVLDRFQAQNEIELYFELCAIQEKLINRREQLYDFIAYDRETVQQESKRVNTKTPGQEDNQRTIWSSSEFPGKQIH